MAAPLLYRLQKSLAKRRYLLGNLLRTLPPSALVGRKPWNSARVPQSVYAPRGMLGAEERRSLYWIGKHYFEGRGAIVDAGAYVGASAYCLAAGVAANGKARVVKPCIFSFDYFRALDDYVVQAIERDFRPISKGDDYLDIFVGQTREHGSLIEAIQGDFAKARWTRGPIEVMFVDVSKTGDLNSHLIREFFPHLIPGRSLVVQQDFHHCWLPHIHITMERLAPYFEIVDDLIDSSRLYRCIGQIPADVIAEVADYRYPAEERLRLLDSAQSKERGPTIALFDVLVMWQLMLDGNFGLAQERYAAFLQRYAKRHIRPWWREAQQVIQQVKP